MRPRFKFRLSPYNKYLNVCLLDLLKTKTTKKTPPPSPPPPKTELQNIFD